MLAPLVIYTKKKRIWPTLLFSAGEAASRALKAKSPRGGDVHTAIIMSRTSFDAYLHELVSLRDLERYIRFGVSQSSKRDATGNRWRMIDDRCLSMPTAKADRESFTDIYKLDFDEKLRTIISLLLIDEPFAKCVCVGDRLKELFWLNRVRNAIVHHNYGGRTNNLLNICRSIAADAGAPIPGADLPWEELLAYSQVAIWSCRIIARSIIEIERLPRNRRIHFEATRDVVLSAMSPLDFSHDN